MSSQGQSLATIDKERRIGAALSVGMQIASAKFGGKDYRFWHMDANAGCGWNDKVNAPGSPLVFWQVARVCLRGMEPAPFFCDMDGERMLELRRRLNEDSEAAGKSALIPGKNEEALEVFAEAIRQAENPKFAVGSVLLDPNGYYYHTAVPVRGLDWFCREFPRIDIVLNLNVRTYWMQQSHNHAVLPPAEVLASLHKTCWLVSRAKPGQNRFLLAVGRNVPTGDHRNLGLHRAESEEGRAVLEWARGDRQMGLDAA